MSVVIFLSHNYTDLTVRRASFVEYTLDVTRRHENSWCKTESQCSSMSVVTLLH